MGHDLQIWDVGERSDIICESCRGSWVGGVSRVSPLPKPALSPPPASEPYPCPAQTRKGVPNLRDPGLKPCPAVTQPSYLTSLGVSFPRFKGSFQGLR